MIYFGLCTTAALGICVAVSISQRLKLVEVLGLAFLLGIGLQTFLMACLDMVGIRLTAISVLAASWLVIAGLSVYLYFRRALLKEWWRYLSTFTYPKISWLWMLALLAIGVVAVMNLTKTMFTPPFDLDSLNGFNLIGKVFAHDGTIKGCGLFTDPNYWEIHGPGSTITYAPLSQLSYAYVYMLGADTSKIANALTFLSFAATFYGVASRFMTHTLAALTTFLTLITPEMLAFSSMSGTNFTHAAYASLGTLFFVAWYYKKIPSLLWIAAALLMINCWSRTEGIAFVGAACCVMLWYGIKNKQYKKLMLFVGLSLFLFVFWNVFLKVYHLEAKLAFIFHPFWDSHKIAVIATEMWKHFKSYTLFGATFLWFAVALLSNVWAIIKKRDHGVTLMLVLLAWMFYNILIYQVDYIWDTLERVMFSSYKRFLFAFVPLLWFYVAAGYNVKWLFGKVEKFLYPPRKVTEKQGGR
ncbi:MAG: hypothetical protein LBF67_02710 [Prevotellaceae bacterium]|nr:hypothetical protein [Prevotellaceae bacterium]